MIVSLVLPCRGSLCKGRKVPIANFYRNSKTLTGLQHECKFCMKSRKDSLKAVCPYEGCDVRIDKLASYCHPHASFMKSSEAPGYVPASYTNKQGYVIIYGMSHPNTTKDKHLREHIYVMAESLGRRIRTEGGEEVHHKNGQRGDNRIENLELWSVSRPAGQRVEDKLEWAMEMIDQYRSEYSEVESWIKRL